LQVLDGGFDGERAPVEEFGDFFSVEIGIENEWDEQVIEQEDRDVGDQQPFHHWGEVGEQSALR
jgi:hypothetical protein